jgi:hypothetical protein
MKLKKGTIKRIHVSQPNIRSNRKDGGDRPVFSVVTSKGVIHGRNVDIKGSSRVVYSPCKPMSCGARVWIETKAEVEVEQ